jgi:hypothetical protein
MRDIPLTLSEHSEDLYDTLEVEFNRAIIYNSNRKNKARVTHEERGYMIRYLIISEAAWKALPPSEKGSQERNRRIKALKYFKMKGTLLIRRPEIIA